MCIARFGAKRVLDDDDVAIAALTTGEFHDAVTRGQNGRSGRTCKIDSLMRTAPTWAKARSLTEGGFNRHIKRKLVAGDSIAVDLIQADNDFLAASLGL